MSIYKIALLVPSLNGGGAERVIINLANFFSDKGYKVWLLTTYQGVYFNSVDSKVTIELLPEFKLRLLGINILKPIPQIFYLIKFLIKNKPDFLLSTLHSANILAPLANVLAPIKTKVIVREANTLNEFCVNNLSFKKKLYLFAMKISYTLANSIIANSPDTAKDVENILNIPKEKIKVICNPVYSPESQNLSLNKTNHQWEKKDYIIAVGRLHPQKDFTTLLKAFTLLQSKHSINLIILGTGNEEKKLKDLATKLGIFHKVDFLGFQDNIYPYLRNAKVFVLSSKWEGFGNVLVEALSVGTPVVATDCSGGPRIILDYGKYGILVKTEEPKAMSNAIEEILSGEKAYSHKELINRAQEFSIEKIGKEYLDHFLSI